MDFLLEKHRHQIPAEEAITLLDSDADTGLDLFEFQARQERFGPNALQVAVVLVNAIIGFLQESKAAKALEALAKMTVTEARVLRSGEVHKLPSVELVPGEQRTVNLALPQALSRHGFSGRIVTTAHNDRDAEHLMDAGSDLILLPFLDAAKAAAEFPGTMLSKEETPS